MNLKSPGWVKVAGVATVCALAGAGAGIAGSTAATSTKTGSTTVKPGASAKSRVAGARGFGPGRAFGHGPSVHEESIVLDEAGKAWIKQTEDRGTVKSVSGDELTITEGTKTVTYKDVTVTVPSGATILRNGKTAKLGDLKAGDHVNVSSSSDGTFVFAVDDTFRPPFGPGGPGGRGPGGPRGFGGHHGPPPAGAPGMYPGAP